MTESRSEVAFRGQACIGETAKGRRESAEVTEMFSVLAAVVLPECIHLSKLMELYIFIDRFYHI